MRVASEGRCLMMASRLHTGGSGQGAGIHDMMGLGGRCNRLSVLVLQNGSEDVRPVSYIAKRSERVERASKLSSDILRRPQKFEKKKSPKLTKGQLISKGHFCKDFFHSL